jgi:hypothetical protein
VAMPIFHDDAKVSTDVGTLLGSVFLAIGAVAGVRLVAARNSTILHCKPWLERSFITGLNSSAP